MTEAFLGWWPILWTARLLVLILLLGAGAAAFLYCLRFFRWRSVAIMWNARLPKIKRVGGKFAGNDFGVDLDEDQDQQFEALARRVEELAVARAVDREAIEVMGEYLLRQQEAQRDFFNGESPPRNLGGDAGTEADR